MALTVRSLALCWLLVSVTTAEYQPWEVGAYATANYCAKQCAAYMYGYEAVKLCGGYPPPASCMCDATNGHSSTMNVQLSLCPTMSSCGGAAEATQAMNVFSAYCSYNLIGVATTGKGTAAAVSNPTGVTTAIQTATPTQAVSGSSDSSSDNSSDSKGLSQSDKIAIGCAIGGAIVAVIVAVPSWMAMRKRRERNAQEAQQLHNPPQMVPQPYLNPAQQPFLSQHQQSYNPNYQHNGFGWGSWK